MKPLSKFFLAILLLTFASTSWADVFLDAFKENYIAGENYQNYEKRLEGGQVVTLGRSAFFAEWSSFYQTKAEGMAGTLTLGKFTTNLSTVKDLAISAASADPIGAATAAAELATVLREISTQASAEDLASNPIVENLIKVYEVVGTAADTAGVAGLISPDTLSVAKLFPAHSKAAKAIAQRNEAWAKTMGVDGKAASKQLGYLSVFNVVLNETLVDSVEGEYDYQQVVWSETIALSLLADKISKLYSNYDLRGLTEDEAFQLMILERDYWQLVIKAKENEIAHEAEKGYVQKLIEVPADLYLSYYYDPDESDEEIKQQAKRRLSNIDKAMRAVSATVAAEAIAAAREKKKQEKVRLAEEKKKQEEARLAADSTSTSKISKGEAISAVESQHPKPLASNGPNWPAAVCEPRNAEYDITEGKWHVTCIRPTHPAAPEGHIVTCKAQWFFFTVNNSGTAEQVGWYTTCDGGSWTAGELMWGTVSDFRKIGAGTGAETGAGTGTGTGAEIGMTALEKMQEAICAELRWSLDGDLKKYPEMVSAVEEALRVNGCL